MNSVRMADADTFALWQPCCRCAKQALGWDVIAGKSYCPACVEGIVQGEADPIIEPTQRRPCSCLSRHWQREGANLPAQVFAPS